MSASSSTIDFIEELMYRCWARRNYLPPELREESWHPVILEEMADDYEKRVISHQLSKKNGHAGRMPKLD